MKILRFIRRNIPNSITCMNLLAGCMASVFAFHFDTQYGALAGYELAFIFIGASVLFDFCDGLSARLLHAYSALGKELDSLADLISFGFAPAALAFNMIMIESGSNSWIAYTAFLLTAAGAVRLAKFNIDDLQKESFRGLPIPSNAIFWVGVIAWNMQYRYIGDWGMLLFIVLFSALMISRIRMFSLKVKSLSLQGNVRRYALLIGVISFVAYMQLAGLVWTILFYIFLSVTAKRDEQF